MHGLWQRILDYDDGLLGPRWAAAAAALYLVVLAGVLGVLVNAIFES